MQAYAAKLIDLIENKAENIAKQWADDVMTHSRTPSFHTLPREMVIDQGIICYRLFRRAAIADDPYKEAKSFSIKYADNFHKENIPLREAIYALILLRRNLWLYAEFQGAFISVLEKNQAVEGLNRTILLFDYVSYQVAEKYEELIQRNVNKKFFAVQNLVNKSCLAGEKNILKYGLIAAFIFTGFVLTFYYFSIFQTTIILTHLFYIPIVLASICWGRKGIWIAFIFGSMLLLSHVIFLRGEPYSEDIIRAVMFVVVGGIMGWLMEDVKRMRALFSNF